MVLETIGKRLICACPMLPWIRYSYHVDCSGNHCVWRIMTVILTTFEIVPCALVGYFLLAFLCFCFLL